MKNRMACLVLAFGCCTAGADELSDGIKAWEQQDYAQAHKIFNKLAIAGNAEAQRQLGEMIGFGEGTPEDLAAARSWLERSRAAGNKDAAESLALVERRASHKADIQHYLSTYDASDLALASYGCVKPAIPESSETKKEIATVHQQIANWYACYGRFVKGLQAGVPAQAASIMNTSELAQIQARMSGTLTSLAGAGRAQAEAVAIAETDWVLATDKKVKAIDAIAKQLVDQEKSQVFRNLSVIEDRRSFAQAAPAAVK